MTKISYRVTFEHYDGRIETFIKRAKSMKHLKRQRWFKYHLPITLKGYEIQALFESNC